MAILTLEEFPMDGLQLLVQVQTVVSLVGGSDCGFHLSEMLLIVQVFLHPIQYHCYHRSYLTLIIDLCDLELIVADFQRETFVELDCLTFIQSPEGT